MKRLMMVAVLLLGACGESTEEAYNRGHDDGITEVRNEIHSFSRNMFSTLQRERIC